MVLFSSARSTAFTLGPPMLAYQARRPHKLYPISFLNVRKHIRGYRNYKISEEKCTVVHQYHLPSPKDHITNLLVIVMFGHSVTGDISINGHPRTHSLKEMLHVHHAPYPAVLCVCIDVRFRQLCCRYSHDGVIGYATWVID